MGASSRRRKSGLSSRPERLPARAFVCREIRVKPTSQTVTKLDRTVRPPQEEGSYFRSAQGYKRSVASVMSYQFRRTVPGRQTRDGFEVGGPAPEARTRQASTRST